MKYFNFAFSIWLLSGCSVGHAEQVGDAKLGFSFLVPDGFQTLASKEKNQLFTFGVPDGKGAWRRLLAIQDMGRLIGRDSLPSHFSKIPGVIIEKAQWKGFQ